MTTYYHRHGAVEDVVQHIQDYLAGLRLSGSGQTTAPVQTSGAVLSGDVTGDPTANTVIALQNTPLSISALVTGHSLRYNGSAWVNAFLDHGTDLGGLADDDHPQYALLAGRAGGQTLKGGTAASETLTLQSTANATRGKLLFGTSAYDEVNNRLGIGTVTPTARLHLPGSTITANSAPLKLASGTNLTTAETGAVEYDGTNLYFTPTGTTRRKVDYLPVTPPDYTVTNHTDSRSLDETGATLVQVANTLGTLINDLIAQGRLQ